MGRQAMPLGPIPLVGWLGFAEGIAVKPMLIAVMLVTAATGCPAKGITPTSSTAPEPAPVSESEAPPPEALAPAGAASFEEAAAIVASAVELEQPSALLPLAETRGIRFVFAPEEQPGPEEWLTAARLKELDALVQQELDGGLPGWAPVHYLVGVFAQQTLGAPDPATGRISAEACGNCDFEFRLAERDGRWRIDTIYVADFEP